MLSLSWGANRMTFESPDIVENVVEIPLDLPF
jgi:ABC-type sulfate transport system permease component